MYIAHIRKSDNKKQLLKDHLIESAVLSRSWGKTIGLEKTCYLAGLLHDLGKYSDEFQVYLKQAVIDPTSVRKGSVDHSTAGGKLLFDLCHKEPHDPFSMILAELVGNAIISHHSSRGLQDFFTPEGEAKSDYLERVVKKEIKEYDTIKQRFFEEVMTEEEFSVAIKQAVEEMKGLYLTGGKMSMKLNTTFFLLKVVYSCLLDADRTNTMLFEEHREYKQIQNKELLERYCHLLEAKVNSFKADTPINELRAQLSNQCKAFAQRETGIYSLSIPTGGGKTLASLRFGLNHAIKHGKERVIYVVPYTTIIEQNAATVKEILQDSENILEHHSNVFSEAIYTKEQEEIERKQALLKDNWEAPVIFTTMVQFLNTIYSKGTRNPRRFHHLMNAVIVFDETQGVPTNCTYLFNECLNFLKNYGQTTSVLCTATQPSLEYVGRKLEKAEDGEMIADLTTIEQQFKRVAVIDKTILETWSLEAIAEFGQDILAEKANLLIILNTKTAVRRLYRYLVEQTEDVQLYHLSTSMCAAHRKRLLKEIKEKLKNKERILCITTQLIEAGVDISFQAVIRSVAGLDSIAQAAGRCNRNGEAEQQAVYLVNPSPELESLTKLPEIAQGKEITMQLLKERQAGEIEAADLLSHQSQEMYFQRYYKCFEHILGYPVKGEPLILFDLLGKNTQAVDHFKRARGKLPTLAFKSSPKTIAEYFKVIDSPATSVLVPYDQGAELIADLNGELKPEEYAPILKKAQQYMVNLFSYEKDELQKSGAIYPLLNGEVLALSQNAYSKEFGVDLSALSENDALLF
ncbi:CRISPR-associated helicase/endonuclease Cas3 [Enterococcus termitis]|uniref:CRISPR-associated helicase/endonuclease Cas3 n=1 Tax=Enterococcus termitis TaxID=332950 RepID=A0A1E5G8M6_9ENTE|nr:CRISPR-associated helicase/endonuclease Cas3 [Enterococcus termitis]OEG09056.1 CRISPR-associated helicase/endonuclease Cas3 [Enterococcus termitis]OJG98504.1 CRISPR-associated helicase cas3 [Enterococcus termitis]